MISLFKVLMSPDAERKVGEVLRSGHIAQGPVVDEFERQLAKAFDLPEHVEVLTVNSGTSALHIAMHLAGVGPGTDVMVTPMTCSATITPIIQLGGTPKWIDVDPLTGLMDPADLADRMTSRTAAIVAVDWAGTPCNHDALRLVANRVRYGISIIEDAAHAMLARDDLGRSIAHNASQDEDGRYVCWSFQAIKHLTTGDGGALLVPVEEVERARKLRWFGLDRRSTKDFRCAQKIFEAGYKFHMNDIAAAIGLANLPLARNAIGTHRINARQLWEGLQQLAPRVRVPPLHSWSSYWVFTILVEDRASFVEFMTENEIEVSQVHRRNDEHPAFNFGSDWPLPGLDEFSAHQISIPCGWWLSSSDVDYIIETVREWAFQKL